MSEKFLHLATIDPNRSEYAEFKNALLALNWKDMESVDYFRGKWHYEVLYYLKVILLRVPMAADRFGFLKTYSRDEKIGIRPYFLNFSNYFEELLPGWQILRGEVAWNPPEPKSRLEELKRMHHDHKIFHNYTHRCQIAVKTNPESLLFVEGEPMALSETEIYAFNNRLCHWGVNWGNTDKLTITLDIIHKDVLNNLDPYVEKHFGEPDREHEQDRAAWEAAWADEYKSRDYQAEFKHKYNL